MDPDAPKPERGIITIIVVLLAALKLDGIITCSWCWILIPWVIIAFIVWIIDVITLLLYNASK